MMTPNMKFRTELNTKFRANPDNQKAGGDGYGTICYSGQCHGWL